MFTYVFSQPQRNSGPSCANLSFASSETTIQHHDLKVTRQPALPRALSFDDQKAQNLHVKPP